MFTSGQDGGIGRYTLPPTTTKRRTTNLKTKNNQNCQKIELYESPTTKELKKKHSFTLVEGWRWAHGSGRGEDSRQWGWWLGDWDKQGSGWRTRVGQARWARLGWARRSLVNQAVPHLHVDKLGGTTGEYDRPLNPGFQHREIKPQNL